MKIKSVAAHCDVPCGIYETDSMIHAAITCKRMVEKALELQNISDLDHQNQFVRIVMYKEEHAKNAKDQLYLLWSDYFKPEHLERFPDLHEKFWIATKQCGKVKQTLSIEECDKLIAQINEIAQMFTESKKQQSHIVKTDNLLLVLISAEYAQAIFDNFTDEITSLMYPDTPASIDDTNKFIDQAVLSNELGKDYQVVITNHQGMFIGCAGLHNIDVKNPEFGVWIKQSSQGNGYGKQALIALKKWADENLEYNYLKYPVDRRNSPSIAIAEALGGEVSKEYMLDTPKGVTLDVIEYRIYPKE